MREERGQIGGDVVVYEPFTLWGSVTGNITLHRGAKVVHSGMCGGDFINEGGRLFIESTAKVMGKIKNVNEKAETKDHRKAT
jgi:cytoskeletal protein CcmA (bactofilin family)